MNWEIAALFIKDKGKRLDTTKQKSEQKMCYIYTMNHLLKKDEVMKFTNKWIELELRPKKTNMQCLYVDAIC